MSAFPPVSDLAAAYERSWVAVGRSRSRRGRWRRPARLLLLGAVGFGAAIACSVTLPMVFGYQTFTVLSGSMAPTIAAGDVVVDARIAPLDARIADVVTFRSPRDGSRLFTHRVVRMRASGDIVDFETKGDANTGTERWSIPANGTLGRVEYRIPKLGYVTNFLGSRLGRLAFIVVPAVLLALTELRRIWRPGPKDPE